VVQFAVKLRTPHSLHAFQTCPSRVFKPDIGMMRELLGKATGKLPTQFHYKCWILADDVPSFVQFEGPLQLMGPILRIELVSPALLIKPEDKKISVK